jgi:hypothetical protein
MNENEPEFRALLAALSMQALIGSLGGRETPEQIATAALQYADALIAELAKPHA